MGKGKTEKIPDAEYQFTRKYLELEVELPQQTTGKELQEALMHAEQFIDGWLEAPEVEAAKIPHLDTAELDALPWKTREREPAKPGQFAWLFGPKSKAGIDKGAEKLVEAIKASKDGKLVIGDMEYTLVKDEAFIQRKPVKKE
jgi:hypothetical protein